MQAVEPGTVDKLPRSATASRPRTILVVEDDELVRSTTCEMLRTLGHEVLEAPDAPTALDMLASNSIDTLVTDVGLPRVSGTILARQARAKQGGLCHRPAEGGPTSVGEGWSRDAFEEIAEELQHRFGRDVPAYLEGFIERHGSEVAIQLSLL
ncbi:response regulator [Bradyrhizobium stylosanthis]|nr:response regulator [Bradyrhizobium stylosanthis]